MTLADFHLAVRRLLVGTPYTAFTVLVEVVEQHPGRVAVEWRVYIPRPGTADSLYHRGGDPVRVLAAVKERVREERETLSTIPPPPDVLDVGAPPPDADDEPSEASGGAP